MKNLYLRKDPPSSFRRLHDATPLKQGGWGAVPISIFAVSVLILVSVVSHAQTSDTWNGSSSTDFATAANWTPSGVPGTGDNITIVSTSNSLTLAANRTVNNLTMTSGTLKLGGYELTASGTVALNGGKVENGRLKHHSSGGSVTFSGTRMECVVDVSTNIAQVNNTFFGDSALLNETHSSGYYGKGNVFDAIAQISNSSTGYIYLGNTSPDSFLAPVTFNLEAAGYIYLSHNCVGTYFADLAVFNNHSGNTARGFMIGGNTGSSTIFMDDIEMNVSSGSGFINFNVGTITHHGALLVGSEGFHSGTLTLNKYRQSGSVDVNLSTMTGTSSLVFSTGFVLEGDLVGPSIATAIGGGCRFKGSVNLPKLFLGLGLGLMAQPI